MQGTFNYQRLLDEDILLVEGTGMLSPSDMAARMSELVPVLDQLRRRAGIARVALDLSDARVQSAPTAEVLAQLSDQLYKPGDRLALICPSALVRMQVKRASGMPFEPFDDQDSAIAWLKAS